MQQRPLSKYSAQIATFNMNYFRLIKIAINTSVFPLAKHNTIFIVGITMTHPLRFSCARGQCWGALIVLIPLDTQAARRPRARSNRQSFRFSSFLITYTSKDAMANAVKQVTDRSASPCNKGDVDVDRLLSKRHPYQLQLHQIDLLKPVQQLPRDDGVGACLSNQHL